MKKQFLHEHHNRQDAVRKEDYRQEMLSRPAAANTWSGVNDCNIAVPTADEVLSMRKSAFHEIPEWWYLYGNTLFKRGMDLSRFTAQNQLTGSSSENIFIWEKVRSDFEHDRPLIINMIKWAKLRRKTDTLFGIAKIYYLELLLPPKVRANGASHRLPTKVEGNCRFVAGRIEWTG